jgi:hypothetical protein
MSDPKPVITRRRILLHADDNLNAERRIVASLANDMSAPTAESPGHQLEVVSWDGVVQAKRRSGEKPPEAVAASDLIIIVMGQQWGDGWGRFASPVAALCSLARRQDRPLLVYFRDVPNHLLKTPDRQTASALVFRDRVERDKNIPCFWFDSEVMLRRMLTDHLAQWRVGHLPGKPIVDDMPDHRRRLAGWRRAIAGGTGDKTGAFRLAQRALAYAGEGRFTKACRCFACAVDVAIEPYLVNEYGLFLKQNGLMEKAREQFEELAQLGQFLGDELVLASACRHLGDIAFRTDRLAEAEQYYDQALKGESKLDRTAKQAMLYQERGQLYLRQQAPAKAVEAFTRSLELFQRLQLKEGEALVHFCLTGAYVELHDAANAIASAARAMAIFKVIGAEDQIRGLQMLLEKLRNLAP